MPNFKTVVCAALLICFLAPVTAQAAAKPSQNPRANQNPSKDSAPVAAHNPDDTRNFANGPKPEQSKDENKVFKLVSADKTVWDWVSYWANIFLAFGGLVGIIIAVCTLFSIKRQTAAMEKQGEHLLASARPWLLIKATGDGINQVIFTAHNTGNSPAQIVWRDPFIPGHEVPVNESLPPTPAYWAFKEGNELVNSIWVEPGGKEHVGIFDSFDAFPMDARLMVYSMVRYRNTFDDTIHESRFCYRISRGIYAMDGPPGYNRNT